MPYVERVTKAGNTIEIERYFTSRYKKKGISRGDKVKPTKEEQEKVNTRQAERKLRILINANYGYGDYHLVLDYIRRKGEPDRTPEQMRQDIDVFLRECRKEYRKAGLEFKYIHVMEIGKKVNVGNEFKYDNDDKKPKPRGGGSAAGGVVVNQYIYANTTDYAKQQKEAARQFRMIARTV